MNICAANSDVLHGDADGECYRAVPWVPRGLPVCSVEEGREHAVTVL